MGDGYAAKGVIVAPGAAVVRLGGGGHGLFFRHSDKAVVGLVASRNPVQEVAGQFDTGKLAGGETGAQLCESLVVHVVVGSCRKIGLRSLWVSLFRFIR